MVSETKPAAPKDRSPAKSDRRKLYAELITRYGRRLRTMTHDELIQIAVLHNVRSVAHQRELKDMLRDKLALDFDQRARTHFIEGLQQLESAVTHRVRLACYGRESNGRFAVCSSAMVPLWVGPITDFRYKRASLDAATCAALAAIELAGHLRTLVGANALRLELATQQAAFIMPDPANDDSDSPGRALLSAAMSQWVALSIVPTDLIAPERYTEIKFTRYWRDNPDLRDLVEALRMPVGALYDPETHSFIEVIGWRRIRGRREVEIGVATLDTGGEVPVVVWQDGRVFVPAVWPSEPIAFHDGDLQDLNGWGESWRGVGSADPVPLRDGLPQ